MSVHDELSAIALATAPIEQGTTLIVAISVFVGLLFSFTAMLPTLTDRRRFVVALRMMTLCGGGVSAGQEMHRMTSEKVTAMAEAGVKLMAGGSADSIVSDYRRKVRANIRRLSK